jgi:hypothetical protein
MNGNTYQTAVDFSKEVVAHNQQFKNAVNQTISWLTDYFDRFERKRWEQAVNRAWFAMQSHRV